MTLLQVRRTGPSTKQASDYNQAAKQAWQLVGDEAQAGLKILAH